MLSPETPAVAIFGAVLDPMVRDKAKKLSDMSGFPVMIRPGVENPIFQFTGSGSGAVEVGQSEALQEQTAPAVGAFRLRGGAGSDDGSVGDDLAESVFSQDDVEDEGETTEDCDSSTPGVFRLRGGAPAVTMDRRVTIAMRPNDSPLGGTVKYTTLLSTCVFDLPSSDCNVAVISRIKFKTQPQVPSDESLESLPFGLVRPEIISLVDLQIKMRDEDTLLDRSHSNLGFLVHRADSIQQCDFLDRGFDEPHVTQKRAQQKSSLVTGGGAFGLTGIQPAAQITGSYARGATDTVESTDDRMRCYPDLGQEWDGDPEKSYGSYDASWKPALNRKGTPYEMKVNFGLGMYLHRDETHGPELPQISSVFRNQIMIWVFDPKLQAKVRGILLLTSTYIPDIKISTSLSIRETVVADMNSDWTMNPPARSDGAPTSEAAASVSLAALDRSKTKNKFGLIKKIGGKLRGQSSEKPEPFELPLYQTVSRGWDPTNKEWKHVLWPTLNKEPTAWKLQWKRDDEEVKEKDQDVGTGKQSAIDPADSGSLLVTKSITDSGIGSTKTASVLTV
ncbi:hypothetical protein C8J57DRAFT_1360008 [Mycena rebaudengoi]|nr:hypothetical protein C8J57DRAFT_1360008 [Mycena rebaudengoi]